MVSDTANACKKKTGIIRRIGQKSLIFGVVVAFTLAILVCIEAGLRLGGVGVDRSLFIKNPYRPDGSTWMVNKAFYAQFFPPDNRQWVLDSLDWGWEIPLRKPPNTKRIMILGGSVALGNQIPVYANSRILRLMLEHSFPDMNFEIYNLAAGALNSNVMRAVANAALKFTPDFFLVYMGNNENIGPFGPAWSPGRIPPETSHIQALIHLQRLRIVQLLQSNIAKERDFICTDALSIFSPRHACPVGSSGRLRMYENYEANLTAICRNAAEAGASTIVSTLGNNIGDWPPCLSANIPNTGEPEYTVWKQYFDEGLQLMEQAEEDAPELWNDALTLFLKARDINAAHAELQYNLAKCYIRQNEFSLAREAYTLARDLDGCFIRADSTINDIIKRCASDCSNTYLIDTERMFIQESTNGIMGDALYYDFVHLTAEGEYLFALSMFNGIQDILLHQFNITAAAPPMSFERSKEVLGYSAYMDALLLDDGNVATRKAVKEFYRNLSIDQYSAAHEQRKAELGPDVREKAIAYMLQTDLYKKGDVTITHCVITELQKIEQEQQVRQGSQPLPSRHKDLMIPEDQESYAKKEATRLLELFPTRPDVHQLARMAGVLSE